MMYLHCDYEPCPNRMRADLAWSALDWLVVEKVSNIEISLAGQPEPREWHFCCKEHLGAWAA